MPSNAEFDSLWLLLKSQDGRAICHWLCSNTAIRLDAIEFSDTTPGFCVDFVANNICFSLNFERNVAALFRLVQCADLFARLLFEKISPFRVNMADEGGAGEICFCSSSSGACLIPDSEFFGQSAYSEARAHYAQQTDWEKRSSIPYWRGSTTGVRIGADLFSLQRVQLCMIGRTVGYDLLIAGAEQITDQEVSALKADGLMGERRPWYECGSKKYNIDIDGNSAAWSSLYTKLLSGGVVVKIGSPVHFKQWYYDLLVPWGNYVPIREDMKDLTDVIAYLDKSPKLAEEIGRSGRRLALSMDLESETTAAIERVRRFVLDLRI